VLILPTRGNNWALLDRPMTARFHSLRAAPGRKRTHWMWFITPKVEGLGSSLMARRYAIKSLAEARAYLELNPLCGGCR